jgi:hypothetical protein
MLFPEARVRIPSRSKSQGAPLSTNDFLCDLFASVVEMPFDVRAEVCFHVVFRLLSARASFRSK